MISAAAFEVFGENDNDLILPNLEDPVRKIGPVKRQILPFMQDFLRHPLMPSE